MAKPEAYGEFGSLVPEQDLGEFASLVKPQYKGMAEMKDSGRTDAGFFKSIGEQFKKENQGTRYEQYSGKPRNILGTNTPSLHNEGRALDLRGPDLPSYVGWAQKKGAKTIIYNRRIYSRQKDGSYKDEAYSRDPHTDHVHIDWGRKTLAEEFLKAKPEGASAKPSQKSLKDLVPPKAKPKINPTAGAVAGAETGDMNSWMGDVSKSVANAITQGPIEYQKQFPAPGRETGLEGVPLPPSSKFDQPTNTAGDIEKTWASIPGENSVDYAKRVSRMTGDRIMNSLASVAINAKRGIEAVNPVAAALPDAAFAVPAMLAGSVANIAVDVPLDLQVLFDMDSNVQPDERFKAIGNTVLNLAPLNPLEAARVLVKGLKFASGIGVDLTEAAAKFSKALEDLPLHQREDLLKAVDDVVKQGDPNALKAPVVEAPQPKLTPKPKTPVRASQTPKKAVSEVSVTAKPVTPKPQTKIQKAAEAAGTERLSALEKMQAARKAQAQASQKGGKQRGSVTPLLPEEIDYFKAWAKEKGLQGAAAVEQFLIHVKDIGDAPATWQRGLEDHLKKEFSQAKKANNPKTTALFNRKQDAEAAWGLINDVEKTKGTTKEIWQKRGEDAVKNGADYVNIARGIADSGTVPTPDQVSILLAGKRRLFEFLNRTRKALDDAIEAGADTKQLREDFNKADDMMNSYLADIQSGKGKWSDVGRALQAGVQIDTGNYADVLAEFARKKGGKATQGEADQIKQGVEKIVTEVKKVAPDYNPEVETVFDALNRKVSSATRKIKADAGIRRAYATAQSGSITKASARQARIDAAKDITEVWRTLAKRVTTTGSLGGAFMGAFEASADLSRAVRKYIVAAIQEARIPETEVADFSKKALRDLAKKVTGKDADDDEIEAIFAKIYDESSKSEKEAASEMLRTSAADKALKEAEQTGSVKSVKKALDNIGDDPLRSRLEKTLEDLKAQQSGGFRPLKKKTETKSPELDPIREEIKNIRRDMRLEDRAETLKEAIRTGVYKGRDKAEVVLTKGQEDAALRVKMLDRQMRRVLLGANRGKFDKHVTGLAQNIRGLLLGSDLGVVLRQGVAGLARPKEFGKALGALKSSVFSPENHARHMEEIAFRRINGKLADPIRRKAGLQLSGDLVHDEELIAANVLKRIPWVGEKIAGSLERAQVSFINELRASMFDTFAAKAGVTEKDLASRARYINAVTGRSNVKEMPKALQVIMTSPRYEASRWETMFEPVRNLATIKNAGSRANMQDIGVAAGELFILTQAAQLAGYKFEVGDPTSSDFLKMRRGDDVWDVTAGMAPRLRDVFRIAAHARLLDNWSNWKTDVGNIGTRVISPGLRVPFTEGSLAMQRVSKKWDRTADPMASIAAAFDYSMKVKDPWSGYGMENDEQGWRAAMPLVIQGFMKALKEDKSLVSAIWAGGREFAGTSVNYYQKPKKKKIRK